METPEARLTRLLSEHAPSLERLVASYARSAAEREDLLQDVAMALWTALPTFRGECSERTFLFRIAHNRAVTFLSKRGPLGDPVEDHGPADPSSENPGLAYEHKERGGRLLTATRALPLRQRQVVTLLLEGLSHREIASVLGVTENNVAVRANRARAALRELLEDQADKETP